MDVDAMEGASMRWRDEADSDQLAMADEAREVTSTELVFKVLKFLSKVLFENVLLNPASLSA